MSSQANNWDKGLGVGAFVVVTIFYGYVVYIAPAFKWLFEDIGTVLPTITRIVFATYLYWSIFFGLLGAVGFGLLEFRGDRRGWLFLLPAFVSLLVFLPVGVWAMYAPVFEVSRAT